MKREKVREMKSKRTYVTWDDIKREPFNICNVRTCSDNKGYHINIDIPSLPERKRFLFVHNEGLDIDRASTQEIRDLLENVKGRQYVTKIFLQNDPNQYGTSCGVSRSEVYILLEDEQLPNSAGKGARILYTRMHY